MLFLAHWGFFQPAAAVAEAFAFSIRNTYAAAAALLRISL